MSSETDGSHDAEKAEQRVTITLEDCTLPADPDEREAALEELKGELGATLAEHRDPASISTTTGHHFAQIDDECPRCGGALELRDYTYRHSGAVAEANCINAPDCEWRGKAVYRLVDLVSSSVKAGESVVTNGNMTPTYRPYTTSP